MRTNSGFEALVPHGRDRVRRVSEKAQDEITTLRAQRAALAEFGHEALKTTDAHALLQKATELVSRGCDIKLVKVLELEPEIGRASCRERVYGLV